MPVELFDLYETVMNRLLQSKADVQELALKTLSWIFYAKRPLMMVELREAVALEDDDCDLEEDDLTPAETLVEVCGSFVIYDKVSGVVGFAHETVKEFFASRYLSRLSSEVAIANACLVYLSFDSFADGPCPDNKTFIARLRKRPFGPYAAWYWGKHLKGDGEKHGETQQKLFKLVLSAKKMNSMAELAWRESKYWEEPDRWHEGKRLFHVLAENDLITIAELVLQNPILSQVFHFLDIKTYDL